MKKLLGLIIIVLIILYGYLYINKIYTKEIDIKFLSIVEEKEAIINNYYIYGNHFNIEGILDTFNVSSNNFSLVLKNEDKEYELDCNFEIKDDKLYFYTSELINQGINLDELNNGNYFLLIKYQNEEEIKYYSLNTKKVDLEYYTITKNKKNNKINIKNRKEKIEDRNINYLKISIKDSKLPDDIYDITIDPGHGGIDSGADNKYNGKTYYEKDITLEIALKLKKDLENKGYKVLLTRDTDKDLDYYNESGRAVIPNKYHTKLCISIHLNSEDNKMNYGGVEVYTPNDIDYKLARLLASNISQINGYSKKIHNKIEDGVYFNGFTEESIKKANEENVKNGLKAYDIKVGTPEMYMIREVGGKLTNAYVDGRNDKFGLNPYYNSNQTAESYLIELGYLSYTEDLIKLIDNEIFSKKISEAINDYYN